MRVENYSAASMLYVMHWLNKFFEYQNLLGLLAGVSQRIFMLFMGM